MNSCGTQTTIDCKCDSALFLMHRDTPGVTARIDDTLLIVFCDSLSRSRVNFGRGRFSLKGGEISLLERLRFFFLASLVKAKYIFHFADVKNCYFSVLPVLPDQIVKDLINQKSITRFKEQNNSISKCKV